MPTLYEITDELLQLEAVFDALRRFVGFKRVKDVVIVSEEP